MRIAKKGTVLPYVMILGSAMLILATALIVLTNVSAENVKNNVSYAQAYGNARSAVSFAQGILKTDALNDAIQSFFVTGTAAPDGGIVFTHKYGAAPANLGNVYAVCTCNDAGLAEITGYVKTPTYSKGGTIGYRVSYVRLANGTVSFTGGEYG